MEIAAINEKPLKMRWIMISFAFLATVLNYIDRLAFNYLSAEGALRKLIPNDSFGYIATAFFAAYMLSNAFSGFFIDRLGTRWAIVFVCSSGQLLHCCMPLHVCHFILELHDFF
jgi:ACS family hexuronate transporter-like MFS transporter